MPRGAQNSIAICSGFAFELHIFHTEGLLFSMVKFACMTVPNRSRLHVHFVIVRSFAGFALASRSKVAAAAVSCSFC